MIRFRLLIFISLAVQLVAIFSRDEMLTRVALLCTYPALIAIALANLRVLGMPLILTGALLNFVSIAANGGLMPVSPESIAEAGGLGSIEGIASGEAIAGTKSILLAEDEMVLAGLADRIVVDLPIVGQATFRRGGRS
jgi:hypothetical protein